MFHGFGISVYSQQRFGNNMANDVWSLMLIGDPVDLHHQVLKWLAGDLPSKTGG